MAAYGFGTWSFGSGNFGIPIGSFGTGLIGEFFLIDNSIPQNFSFLLADDTIIYDGNLIGANTPITDDYYVHHGPITATLPAYDVTPFVRPIGEAVYETAESNAVDLHGLTWPLTDPTNQKWLNILTSSGTISLKSLLIIPTKTQWQSVSFLNILSGALGNQILYVNIDGYICLTDGTNTAISPVEYNAGIDHNIVLVFGGGHMQIIMDGVKGGIADYVGTFDPGDTLKYALNNKDVMKVVTISGKDSSQFEFALPLNQTLNYTI